MSLFLLYRLWSPADLIPPLAGQHCFLHFLDPSFASTPTVWFQSHPFSIANVPTCTAAYDNGHHDMLFVMRTRKGMTKVLADRLAKSPTGTADLWCTVEGPYGGATDTEQFHEILLVAGGAGISHVMSSASLPFILLVGT